MLMEMSQGLCVNPVYLVMSAVITCSNAFMLPVATAPNALVFGAMNGKISTSKMMLIGLLSLCITKLILCYSTLVLNWTFAGFPLNIISLLVTMTAIETWGRAMFDLNQYREKVGNEWKDVNNCSTAGTS